MRVWSRRALAASAALVFFLGLDLALVAPGPRSSHAVEPPLELKWAQLVPPAPPGPPKSFLAGRPAIPFNPANPHEGTPPASLPPEGRWMSGPGKSGDAPAPVVTALDGKRVRIGGYVVSLDFDATRVKEFLLVPFVGACIHVPPPPANQIVYVKSDNGFDVSSAFEPVWVTGTLKVTTALTDLAEAGYSLDAEMVEHR
ncbi:MAG: DUF3299 domain-containing protein [Hyphomicrobiaceae bacterium]|nr:DUF3299 domain-containing protein [Hyphomicrobiaceae bacterium]